MLDLRCVSLKFQWCFFENNICISETLRKIICIFLDLRYLLHYYSDNSFKGTGVNMTFPSSTSPPSVGYRCAHGLLCIELLTCTFIYTRTLPLSCCTHLYLHRVNLSYEFVSLWRSFNRRFNLKWAQCVIDEINDVLNYYFKVKSKDPKFLVCLGLIPL